MKLSTTTAIELMLIREEVETEADVQMDEQLFGIKRTVALKQNAACICKMSLCILSWLRKAQKRGCGVLVS
jgi:hypothetical protein